MAGKEDFDMKRLFHSWRVAKLDWRAHIVLFALVEACDDDGRFDWTPGVIRDAFANDKLSDEDIEADMQALLAVGVVSRDGFFGRVLFEAI